MSIQCGDCHGFFESVETYLTHEKCPGVPARREVPEWAMQETAARLADLERSLNGR